MAGLIGCAVGGIAFLILTGFVLIDALGDPLPSARSYSATSHGLLMVGWIGVPLALALTAGWLTSRWLGRAR